MHMNYTLYKGDVIMQTKRDHVHFANLGTDIKRARKALGLTQASLSEAVGCSVRYIANIENSGSIPSVPLLHEIANVCKIPIEKYFYIEKSEVEESPERERITLKLLICPDKYLPFVESALDTAIKLNEIDTAGRD